MTIEPGTIDENFPEFLELHLLANRSQRLETDASCSISYRLSGYGAVEHVAKTSLMFLFNTPHAVGREELERV